MGTVFISYRREQTPGEARALYNELVLRLGKNSVFMDVANISLDRDFRLILEDSLASCDLMIVLIGKDWLLSKNEAGRFRLENPDDFIRLEVGTALKRNIPVTPVLVQGARMPSADQLPEDLQQLSYRNGFELSHSRWESDVQEMIRRLGLRSTARSLIGSLTDKRSLAVLGSLLAIAVASGVFVVRERVQRAPELIPPLFGKCEMSDAVSDPSMSGQKNCIRLTDPKVRVYGRNIPLDYCLKYGEECGPSLWNWYCKRWAIRKR